MWVRERGLGRFFWLVAAALTIGAFIIVMLVGLAGLALIGVSGDLGCELQGSDSNYGALSWSVVPPGPVCTYTQAENGVDEVDGPASTTSLWILSLLGLGIASGWSVRKAVPKEAEVHTA